MTPGQIALYMPTRGSIYYRSIEAIFQQVLVAANDYGEQLPVRFVQGNASVASVRNLIVQDFLKTDREALLMVDDDVIVPDHFFQLLDTLDDYPIVGAPCLIVRPGTIHTPNVYFWNAKNGKYEVRREVFEADEAIECDAVGSGCIAVRREVFKKIKRPFDPHTDKDGIIDIGEDLNFCRRAKSQGFKVAADMRVLCDHWQTLHGNSLSQAYLEVIRAVSTPPSDL